MIDTPASVVNGCEWAGFRVPLPYDRRLMMFDDDFAEDGTTDRLAALRAMTHEQIGRVLSAQPEVAAALAGKGLLLSALPRLPKDGKVTILHLAAVLGHPATVRIALQGIGSTALRLLMVSWMHDGQLTEADVVAEAPSLDAAARERARAELVDHLLIDTDRGYIVARPGVMAHVPVPGRSMREIADSNFVTSEMLLDRLTRLGVRDAPSRKLDRLRLLMDILGDRQVMHDLVRALGPVEASLLKRLSADPLPLEQFDTNYYYLEQLRYQARYDRFASTAARTSPDTLAMHNLEALGIVGVSSEHTCWVWLEAWTALTGHVFPVWPAPAVADLATINAPAAETPAVVGQLQIVLNQVQAEPLAGLKTGGVGVKVTRDLAKRLGQAPRLTEVLVGLARSVRVMDERSEIVGRGRASSWSYTYGASPSASAWAERPALDRWALLVDAWVHARDIADHSSVYGALNRRQLVADLMALPEGFGVVERTASDWYRAKHIVSAHVDVDELFADARLVGLVPMTGPLGLSELARAVLTDPADAHRLLPDSVQHFVVQPDHSVVTPPNLDANVRARLERLAVLSSSGSALVFRLDDVRIGHDLAAGETADAICAFLVEHSSVPVAPVVEQFVRDIERRRGGLTLAGAATVLTADDTLGLAEAIKVKAARLRLIAPTVAVSDLPPAKVLAALRARGLAPRSALPAAAPPTASRPGPTSARAGDAAVLVEPVPVLIHPNTQQLLAKVVVA